MVEKKYVIDYPNLMAEWDWNKNNEINLDPSKITHGSKSYAYWKCQQGHSWPSKIANRTLLNRGCRECSIKKRGTKKSIPPLGESLFEVNPELAKEWHPTKNGSLKSCEIYPNAKKFVWWRCIKGHEWQAYVYSRNAGAGCKQCQKELHSSFPEKCVCFYALKYYSDVQANYKSDFLKNMEFDIFIPSLKVAIEYDGDKWHTILKNDIKKNLLCENNQIRLIRIRERNCPKDDNFYRFVNYLYLDDYSIKELEKAIVEILGWLGKSDVDVDIERDRHQIAKLQEKGVKENSIASQFPSLLKEWDYEKNKDISPDVYTHGDNTKVWWICSNGHSYPASINHRVDGTDCPYCAGKKVYIGFNDLASKYPDLVKEWHPDNILKPTEVTAGCNKKVKWICAKGHEYMADPKHRVNGTGCSVCAGKVVIAGVNDFASIRKDLLKEWHPIKNLPLLPSQVSKSSGVSVWWVCKTCGHEWPARVNKRVSGTGCPECYRKQRKGKIDSN